MRLLFGKGLLSIPSYVCIDQEAHQLQSQASSCVASLVSRCAKGIQYALAKLRCAVKKIRKFSVARSRAVESMLSAEAYLTKQRRQAITRACNYLRCRGRCVVLIQAARIFDRSRRPTSRKGLPGSIDYLDCFGCSLRALKQPR